VKSLDSPLRAAIVSTWFIGGDQGEIEISREMWQMPGQSGSQSQKDQFELSETPEVARTVSGKMRDRTDCTINSKSLAAATRFI
jgi:hypothetical protein